MNIEQIEIEELKKFAQDALADGWEVEFKAGTLFLTNHKVLSDVSIFWEEGWVSWRIVNRKAEKPNVVPVGELIYPNGLFFNTK